MKYLPPHHIELLTSTIQLARLFQLQNRNLESLDLWESALDGLMRVSESTVTNSNIFSLFLFFLPTSHFVGVYEAEPPPGRSMFKVTRKLLGQMSLNPTLLDVPNVKSNIIKLYFNTLFAVEAFPKILKLFQLIRQISTGMSQLAYGSSELDHILEFIDGFPHLLTKEELLGPAIKFCLPLPTDRTANGTNISALFQQLIEWSIKDLMAFQKQSLTPDLQTDVTWDASHDLVSQIKPKYSTTTIERFLSIKSPLDLFDSTSLTILLSVLFHYMDVTKLYIK